MLSLDTALLFMTASTALALSPGPDNLFVLTQSAVNGRLAGLLVTLGICLGLVVQTLLVALGIAVLFKTSPLAFTLLKYLGAAYLLYLAWQAFRSGPAQWQNGQTNTPKAWQLVGRGALMNLTNPKVIIFFLAFLPQFVQPEAGSVTAQLVMLGVLFMVCAAAVFSSVAVAGDFLAAHFRGSERTQGWLNRIAGGVFVALAVRLAWQEA